MARYSEEFKQDAINLVKNKGYSVQEVAKKLGVNRQTLYKWLEGIRLHKKATSMHDLEIENSKLRKQLAQAEEEREILKKPLEIHTFNATLQDLDLNRGGLYGKYKTKESDF